MRRILLPLLLLNVTACGGSIIEPPSIGPEEPTGALAFVNNHTHCDAVVRIDGGDEVEVRTGRAVRIEGIRPGRHTASIEAPLCSASFACRASVAEDEVATFTFMELPKESGPDAFNVTPCPQWEE